MNNDLPPSALSDPPQHNTRVGLSANMPLQCFSELTNVQHIFLSILMSLDPSFPSNLIITEALKAIPGSFYVIVSITERLPLCILRKTLSVHAFPFK